MARIKDVAQAARVSSATVSRVLSNKGQVRDSTRKKVLEAVDALGYTPSRVARSLRVRSSQIIGVIISDIQNPFFTALVRAVEDIAHENNFAIFLCNSDENPDKESLYLDLMIAEQVAGVIFTPTGESINRYEKLTRIKCPVVAVDRRIVDCDIDTVVLDNKRGAYEATSYLIEMNHTKIGAILGSYALTTGRERYEGFSAALSKHKLKENPDWVKFGTPAIQTGLEMGRKLLSGDDRPSAVFTGNNLITLGFLHAVREIGLSIPNDISLVAFDDPVWSSLVSPQLTVVAQPTYEIGKIAADIVLKRIRGFNGSPEMIVLQPELIKRQSVKRLPIDEFQKGGVRQ